MKSEFLTDLDMRAVQNGYVLLAPLKYRSVVLDEVVEVPAAFFTNLASIPRIARILITGHGNDRWAAVVHDYLYSIGYRRAMADRVFLEALEASGANWLKRRTMYRAVRTGGWMFYSKEQKENTIPE